VKQLFDDYSSTFEKSLDALVYNVPTLLSETVKSMNTNFSLMVDLGCGTGLLGPLLRPHTTHMIGIDLSPKMLAIAEQDKIGIYDHLFIGDMTVLLSCLEKHRNKKEPKSDSVRRKLHGSIIRDVSNVRDEGFGGAFLGGNGWLGEGEGEGRGKVSGKEEKGDNKMAFPLPLLVTAADVLGTYFRTCARMIRRTYPNTALLSSVQQLHQIRLFYRYYKRLVFSFYLHLFSTCHVVLRTLLNISYF
jgi:SAM-dependent methyltransferase